MKPVEVFQQVIPCHWRQWLLVLEGVGHVVVRNVGVGGRVVGVFNKLCWIDGLGPRVGLARDRGDGGRHV